MVVSLYAKPKMTPQAASLLPKKTGKVGRRKGGTDHTRTCTGPMLARMRLSALGCEFLGTEDDMPQTQLDHIVITAPSLAAGAAYVHRTLGVAPQKGGEHPQMGTHNCVVKLGQGRTYLEVIAANPNARSPQRSRWFGLDHVRPDDPPRLATWVARTDDIQAAVSLSPVPLGSIEHMTRDQLHWNITIPKDGGLPCQGIAPTLIQWPQGTHPTVTMNDLGCSLVGLEAFHPEAGRVSAMLQAIGFDGEISIRVLPCGASPFLVVHIRSPLGVRQFRRAAY
ncbi:MAG: VOC family protein [Bradyrhizobiaceae bacterium]|nr:VOC family protein [Bradyrhizobiaceae bacterium]